MAKPPADLVPISDLFVMARHSVSGRPMLMHRLQADSASFTLCSRDMSPWSRVYLRPAQAKPLIELMLCRSCRRIGGTL